MEDHLCQSSVLSGNVKLRKARRMRPQCTDALVCLIVEEIKYQLLKFLRERWTRHEHICVYIIVSGVLMFTLMQIVDFLKVYVFTKTLIVG